mgnify:FL=1
MKKYRIVLSREDKKDVLNVEGCFGIEKYSQSEVSVILDGFILSVLGKNLVMPVMSEGNLMICGNIEELKKVISL